jgi:hypothetical protein
MNPNKPNKAEVKIEPGAGPFLNKKDVAKWAGHWTRMELTVYHVREYFATAIQPLVDSVVNYYARYGVLIYWRVGELDSSLKPRLARVKMRTATGLPLPDNPELQYLWEHCKHTPSIFFVGDISVKGRGGLHSWFGPDVEGFTFLNTFAFVAHSNAPWIPQYDVTIARELGHVLGLTDDPTGVSLMSKGYHADLGDNSFLPTEAAALRSSAWLRRTRNPQPNLDSKSGVKK